MIRGILYPPNLFNLYLVASYVASLISAIIMFHVLSGSTSIRVRVKGEGNLRLFTMEEDIFFARKKNKRRREKERERKGEKKIMAKTTRPSRPFPRNPHAVSFYRSRHRTVLKIRKRRCVSSGESQSVSQSIGKRACACLRSGKFVANSVLSGSVEKLSNAQ